MPTTYWTEDEVAEQCQSVAANVHRLFEARLQALLSALILERPDMRKSFGAVVAEAEAFGLHEVEDYKPFLAAFAAAAKQQ